MVGNILTEKIIGGFAICSFAFGNRITQPVGDKELFARLLQQALAIKDEAGSPLTTQNEVMRRRAQWLLEKIDDLF